MRNSCLSTKFYFRKGRGGGMTKGSGESQASPIPYAVKSDCDTCRPFLGSFRHVSRLRCMDRSAQRSRNHSVLRPRQTQLADSTSWRGLRNDRHFNSPDTVNPLLVGAAHSRRRNDSSDVDDSGRDCTKSFQGLCAVTPSPQRKTTFSATARSDRAGFSASNPRWIRRRQVFLCRS